jgi:uncharacterized protein YoxC
MKFILLTLAFYLILRFVIRFVLPVIRMTSAAKAKMREMQQQMEGMQQQANTHQAPKPKVSDGDYIDYEEIK